MQWVYASILFVLISSAVQADETKPPRREVFGGVSIADGAVFGYLTGVSAIGGGLYSPGWRVRAMVGHGHYSYYTGNRKIRGKVSVVEVMPGRQFVRGPFILKLYAGWHFERHDLDRIDPANSTNGSKFGLTGISEMWLDIGKKTYASLDVSISSVYRAYASKARLGWRAFKGVAIGPEFSALGTRTSDTWRAGSFLRSKYGRFAGTLSGGYGHPSGGRGYGYGELSVEVKF